MQILFFVFGVFFSAAPSFAENGCPATVTSCAKGVLVTSAVVNGCPIRECKDPENGLTIPPSALKPPAPSADDSGAHRY